MRTATNCIKSYKIVCPVCGEKATYATDNAQNAHQLAVDEGWHWSRKVSASDAWYLVCPKHYTGRNSRKIYQDAHVEEPTPVELPLKL